MKHKKILQNTIQAFTLVELLVVVAIFTLISGLVMANYPQFNSRTSLVGLVQQMAVSVREAQVYGVSVRNATTSGIGGGVYPAYGVYFSTRVGDTYGGATSYSLFFDKITTTGPAPYYRPKGDGLFGLSEELVEKNNINNGNKIVRIYGKKGGIETNDGTCPTGYTCAKAVHISFLRPNPDAGLKLSLAGSWGSESSVVDAGQVHIEVQSKDTKYCKDLVVYSSGQISIESSLKNDGSQKPENCSVN